MILTGLGLAQLAAVFGALGLCVVALYLLKLRRRTVAVPFAPLWERVLKDKEASSLFAKLKRLVSMLLQLFGPGAARACSRQPARSRKA